MPNGYGMNVRGDMGLSDALAAFIQMQQGKKQQSMEMLQAEFEKQMAERKFAEDTRHRKEMEEYYQGMLAERQKPDPTKFQQYDTDTQFGAFDPSTGQYTKRGDIAAEPEQLTPKEQYENLKYEMILKMSPDEQKRVMFKDLFKDEKPDRSKEFKTHQDVTGMAAGMAGEDAWKSEGLMSPEQKTQWISHIYNQLNTGIPISQVKPPQIREVSPRKEGSWPFGSDTPAVTDTTFFGQGGAPAGTQTLTPQEQEIVEAFRNSPNLTPDWDSIKADYPDVDIERMKIALQSR